MRLSLARGAVVSPAWLGVATSMLAPVLPGQQIKVQDRSRFCVKHAVALQPLSGGRRSYGENAAATFADAADGQWTLQGYPPLIDERAGTVYEQVIFTGKWLSKVRLRSFHVDYALTVEYRFNEAGELVGTRAAIERAGYWYAEAKLYSVGHGGVAEPSITYSRRVGGSPMQEPEDGRDYAPTFSSVRIYKTTTEIPCAGLLKEAEVTNANTK